MNAQIDTKAFWGTTQKKFIGMWSDPSSSVAERVAKTSLKNLEGSWVVAETVAGSEWAENIRFKKKPIIERVSNIENKIEALTELFETLSKPDEIEIRDISYAQAKKEIRQYFSRHHGEDITAADLEENLGIDFELASEVCESLEKKGKIKGV